jgi:hypothetical protein
VTWRQTVAKSEFTVSGGISPKVGVVLVIIGVACFVSWTFLNQPLALVLLTTLGVGCLLAGVIGPLGYFRLTRLSDGIKYERRYSSRFFPYSTIRNARIDLKIVRITDDFRRRRYTGSSASFIARIVLSTTTGESSIELNSFMPYNRDKRPTPEASLAEAWDLLQRQWRAVFVGPQQAPGDDTRGG